MNKYQKWFQWPIDDSDINQVTVYLETGQIKKLHYEYGNLILLISLRFAENKEDYKCCKLIKDFIEAVNKYNPETIPQNLEKWLQRNTLQK